MDVTIQNISLSPLNVGIRLRVLVAVIVFVCAPWRAPAQEGARGGVRERMRQRMQQEQSAGTATLAARRMRPQASSKNDGESIELAGLKVSVWRPAQRTGRVPLVIFSHGFHGMSTQSTFLTAALAENGYLVVAPNHKDAIGNGLLATSWLPQVSFIRPDQWNDKTYLDRAEDIRRLIKALHEQQPWAGMIDWSRLALAGHSLGGYTALGLAGAWPSWKLPEVKAVLACSPFAQPFAQQHSLERLGVPVMYQGGTRDIGLTPFVKRSGGAFDLTASPAYFVDFENAGHLAWTDLTAEHQANVKHYALAFLNKYLKDDDAAKPAEKRSGVAELRSK